MGVRLGRPRQCSDDVLALVVDLAARGVGPTAIADALNARRAPTPGGRVKWWPSYVFRLLQTQDARRLLERGAQGLEGDVSIE